MKKYFAFITAILLVASCRDINKKNTETITDMNPQFDQFKSTFVEELWKLYPGWASSQGYHKYDSILVIPDEAQREREKAFAKANFNSLKIFDLNSLSDNNKTDYYIIENFLNGNIWSLSEEKSFEWNPSSYNVSERFAEMINNNYDTLDTRLRNLYLRMANIPAYYEAAKKNIKNPTIEHTQLAIDQITGGLTVFEKDLPEALNKSQLDDIEKNQIKARAGEAVNSIKNFVEWLKAMKNDSPQRFRLGKDLYMKKFEFEIQSGYKADQIYDKAIAHKHQLHQKMSELSSQLWSNYFKNEPKPKDTLIMIRMMIDKLSLVHVKPDSFQSAIEQQIPVLVNFVKEKNLL